MSNNGQVRSLWLIASCADRIGIVARVATFLAGRGASITQANQFEDLRTRTFFMRYGFDIPESDGIIAAIAEDFHALMKLVIGTQFHHCLSTGEPGRVAARNLLSAEGS